MQEPIKDDVLVDINIPRLLLASAEQGSGTSTVFLGLLVALSKSGVSTAVANIGHSLVEATHYRRISGRFAHTIDLWSLNHEQAVQSFAKLSAGADIVLFSGENGVYDNLFPNCWAPHEAGIADALNMPIVLVLNVEGYRESIAALVKGFIEYWPKANIAGIIANRVTSDKHNQIIRKAVESLNGPVYLGGVPVGDSAVMGKIEEIGINPSLLPRSRILGCGDLVGNNVDLQSLVEISKTTQPIKVISSAFQSSYLRCRVAVADDVAFHLTIQDNLDLLRRVGAKLVAFSPIADFKLPTNIDAIYLSSGYIQLYASNLQQNEGMRSEIVSFAKRGGVIFAEGSASAYLSKKIITYNGEAYNMVGVLPAVANALRRDSEWGKPIYCELTSVNDSPISKQGQIARGYKDSRWLIRLEHELPNAFNVCEIDIDNAEILEHNELDGLMPFPNVIASNLHIHWASNPSFAENFISFMTARKETS